MDKTWDCLTIIVFIIVFGLCFITVCNNLANAQPDPQVVWDVELNSTLTFKPGSGSMDDSLENRSWQGPVDKVIYNDTLITFIDGADLQRQYREIAGGKCDTTIVINTGFVVAGHPDSIYLGDNVNILRVGSATPPFYRIWYEVLDTTIRCRTNVRIAIVPEYWMERSVTTEYSPPKEPQALIYWEWK